ncbi:hypothetical protein L3X38_029592 [Prunus dulcis]|uniref:Calmodulin-binding domain-containing protein n=1 Tax=Prunus dulcis TaxID=3755 RepID=A0AAD4VRX6_PRUDU|nr:hypothetical protein L3X38_029592 [Prunus dulcis]
MEVENVGIPVILQDLDLNGDKARRNSIPVIPQELEPNDGDVRRNSISVIPQETNSNVGDIRRNSIPEIPQEMEPKGGNVRGDSNLVIPQEIEANGGGDSRRSSIGKVDPLPDIKRNSIPVIPQEMESNGDDRNSIAGIPQEIKPSGSDIKRNHIPAIPHEMETKGGDVRMNSIESVDPPDVIIRNSISMIPQGMEFNGSDASRSSVAVIPQEIEPNGSGIRRNSIPVISQETEPKGGDIRRNYLLVIPLETEPNGDNIRKNRPNIGVKIQSRYLRARTGSCHDYCKYGVRNPSQENAPTAMPKSDTATGSAGQNLKATNSADTERKKMPRTSPKPSLDSDTQKLDYSVVTEKKVISTTARKSYPDSGTRKLNNSVVTEKKVLSPREIDVCTEDLVDLKVKADQLEPSSLPGSVLSLNNLEGIATINPKSSPDSEIQTSVVAEKRVSSSFNDIEASSEDSLDLKLKAEQLEPSSLPGSVLSLSNSKGISTISPKLSPDTETLKLDHSVVTEKRVLLLKKKEKVSLKKVSTNVKEIDACTEGSLSRVKPEQLGPSSLPGKGSHNQGKNGSRKVKEILEGSSSRGNRKISSRTLRTSVLVEKKMLGPETVSLTSVHPLKRVSNVNTGSCEKVKGSSHLKDQNNPREIEPEGSCNKDMPEEILYVIESNTENNTVELTPNGINAPKLLSPSPLKVKSLKQARKGIGSTRSPPSSEKTKLKRTANGGYGRSPAPLCPDNKGLRRSTLASLSSSSPASSSMSIFPSQSTHKKESGATFQHNTMNTDNQIVNLKAEHKTRPRRSGVLSSDSKNSLARKLKFRRGRVVDLKPENNTPRRLKFRKVRLARDTQNRRSGIKGEINGRKEVDDNQSNGTAIRRGTIGREEVDDSQSNGAGIKRGSIGQKDVDDSESNDAGTGKGSTGRKEVDDSQSNGAKIKREKVVMKNQERDLEGSRRKSFRRKYGRGGMLNGTDTSPEKVVLRHQDVKGRKDVQNLFNNVIKETASRLVESRKSKVKALVGAFETVISLQDARPSTVEDAC